MAKRKAPARKRAARPVRKAAKAGRSVKRQKTRTGRASRVRKAAGSARRAAGTKKKAPRRAAAKTRRSSRARTGRDTSARAGKMPRLDRVRRQLDDDLPTPPSSLDMERRGSAARTGRAELAESLHEHPGMTPAFTGGDVDANWQNAYFSGDEAPGGDNPTPDQDVVEDIGRSLGVEYQDNEELRSSDKVVERDKHRWELDPASSEDYKERK